MVSYRDKIFSQSISLTNRWRVAKNKLHSSNSSEIHITSRSYSTLTVLRLRFFTTCFTGLTAVTLVQSIVFVHVRHASLTRYTPRTGLIGAVPLYNASCGAGGHSLLFITSPWILETLIWSSLYYFRSPFLFCRFKKRPQNLNRYLLVQACPWLGMTLMLQNSAARLDR